MEEKFMVKMTFFFTNITTPTAFQTCQLQKQNHKLKGAAPRFRRHIPFRANLLYEQINEQ